MVAWKHEEIRSLFGEDQMQRIIAIPLVNIELQDALVWRGDNTGIYTAKTGYKWRNTIETPNIQQNFLSKFYRRLWDMKVPSKIRIHLWRVAKKYMSVLFNLKISRLVNNTMCRVCHEDEETISHVYRDCSFTRQVLRELGCGNSPCNTEANWNIWLAVEYENLAEEECIKRTIFFWDIWYNRNKVYHEGSRANVHDTVEFINAYYAEIKHVSDVTKSRNEINNKAWRPPNDNRIKVNFDAAFKQNQNKSVSGIIARNKEGEVMAACTYPRRNIVDPTITEARACLQAVTMAEDLGFQEVEVKGDALTVIKKREKPTE